jgi:hypothetical protein
MDPDRDCERWLPTTILWNAWPALRWLRAIQASWSLAFFSTWARDIFFGGFATATVAKRTRVMPSHPPTTGTITRVYRAAASYSLQWPVPPRTIEQDQIVVPAMLASSLAKASCAASQLRLLHSGV